MASKNVYDELADMMVAAPTGAPELKVPEFLQHLRLQYTPREARIAVQVGIAGGTLDELVTRTGVDKAKLKEILNTMSIKGTIWFDPAEKDPKYKAVGVAGPGICETPFWGGIKNADTVPLARLWNKWKRQWVRYGLGKRGGPVSLVWPVHTVLPADATPAENVAEVLKKYDHFSISICPCRFGEWVDEPGKGCRHIAETCLHMGPISRWTVAAGMARDITYDEAIQIMRKAGDDGLVTTFVPVTNVLCNCCGDCCPLFIGVNEMGMKLLKRTSFVSVIDEETCNACGTCATRCPVKAIEVNEVAVVDPEICLGCGVCVPTCKPKAAKLARRPA